MTLVGDGKSSLVIFTGGMMVRGEHFLVVLEGGGEGGDVRRLSGRLVVGIDASTALVEGFVKVVVVLGVAIVGKETGTVLFLL
jgi:hypothetical protein